MSSEDGDKTDDEGRNKLREEINEVWNQIAISEEQVIPEVNNSPGWKTVRIFVSSTFKDFHQEREILVKKVFADLRAWCEERQLHLIDCDLRWGVPKETTSEVTLKTCLEEIDRCKEDNRVPYFLNMTCKRIGWIPMVDELPPNLLKNYQLVFGLSVTEMEIVHAAYRVENPNALFLIRDDAFLNDIQDEEIKKEFIDEVQPKADTKLDVLKDKITSRFSDRVFTYKCKYIEGERLYSDYMTKKGRPKLELDDKFSEIVLKFFKERIEEQYPVVKKDIDAYQDAKFHHEAFMKSRCEIIMGVNKRSQREMIIGREGVLTEIKNYIESEDDASGYSKLIVGEAGAGKSSIMAKAASNVLDQMHAASQPCKVFFHFVGAVPNSTNLLEILRRLLKEMQPTLDLPETLEDTEQLVKSELSNYRSGRLVIFMDALNQVDRDMHIEPMFWLPDKLAPNVRCILSLITDSEPHRVLRRRKDFPKNAEIVVPDLDPESRLEIVNNYLSLFNKKLATEQMVPLLGKKASYNPLWLRIACEELRIYGDFNTVTNFIKLLSDTLPGLLQQVLERFERETDRVLLVSTLCLLEASRFGLLESELLEILADKDNLEYRETSGEYGAEGSGVIEKSLRLPYAEWASVYRNLRIFLRPYGNPNEGRLDFYHRTLSKVVQDLYLDKQKSDADYNKKLYWWHKKLADYYRNSRTYERKVEEYPNHLLFLKRHGKSKEDSSLYCKWLQEFLLDMSVFKRLYDDEFSETLLYYWRESGDEDYEKMCAGYEKEIREMQKDVAYPPDVITEKFEDVSRVMIQAGKYEKGLQLAEECLKMVTDFPGQFEKDVCDEKLMYLYGHIAHIKSLLLPPTQSAKEIPQLHEIIDYHSKAIRIINESGKRSEKKYKKYLALQLIKTAYARGGIASRCDTFSFSNLFSGKKVKKEMTEQGCKEVEKAIHLYQELKDYGHELEAQLTKATLHRGNKEEQLKIYGETKRRCEDIVGKKCPLMCRLCFNMGVVYGRDNDETNAYSSYKQAYIIARDIYGTKHVKTEKYKTELLKYKHVAKKLKDDFEKEIDEDFEQ